MSWALTALLCCCLLLLLLLLPLMHVGGGGSVRGRSDGAALHFRRQLPHFRRQSAPARHVLTNGPAAASRRRALGRRKTNVAPARAASPLPSTTASTASSSHAAATEACLSASICVCLLSVCEIPAPLLACAREARRPNATVRGPPPPASETPLPALYRSYFEQVDCIACFVVALCACCSNA